MKRSKYRNLSTVVDGIRFDSIAEAHRYKELCLMQDADVIADLELQPKYVIQDAYTKDNGERVREISYKADFRYWDMQARRIVIEDVKGYATKEFLLKKKLVEKIHGIEIVLIKNKKD